MKTLLLLLGLLCSAPAHAQSLLKQTEAGADIPVYLNRNSSGVVKVASWLSTGGNLKLEHSLQADSIVNKAGTGAPSFPNGLTSTGTISGPGAVPTGALMPYAGTSTPDGWLLCDGTAVSRTTYAELFAAIGTAYGAGNGSTTFNLPNLTGRYPIGINSGDVTADAMGETGGSATSAHTHSVTSNVAVATQPTFTVDSHTHTTGVSFTSGEITQPAFSVSSHTHDLGNHTHNIAHYHFHSYITNSGGLSGTTTVRGLQAATDAIGSTSTFNDLSTSSTFLSQSIGFNNTGSVNALAYAGDTGFFSTTAPYTNGRGSASAAASGGPSSNTSGSTAPTASRTTDVAIGSKNFASGAASANTTTRTANVALTNNAVTSGAASSTENRAPYVVVRYIIKN